MPRGTLSASGGNTTTNPNEIKKTGTENAPLLQLGDRGKGILSDQQWAEEEQGNTNGCNSL